MVRKIGKLRETKEVSELKNQLARALADYDNLRKRVEAEKEVWERFSTERVLLKLIPILDILERAENHLKDEGLAIAIGEFKKVLKEEGIEEIRPQKGDNFDAEIHEVVDVVSGGEKDSIAELILVGWRFKDGKVIRPAKVKVYDKQLEKKEELEKEISRGDYV